MDRPTSPALRMLVSPATYQVRCEQQADGSLVQSSVMNGSALAN